MLSYELIKEEVVSEIQLLLKLDNTISPDKNLLMLGLNSLKAIELIVILEEKFNVEFLDEELTIDLVENVNVLTEKIINKLNHQSDS